MEYVDFAISIALGAIFGLIGVKIVHLNTNIALKILISLVVFGASVLILKGGNFLVEHNHKVYLVTAFIGAVILLFVAKLVRR